MRTPIRTKKRDTTKQRIFDAATRTFAKKGFAGARMDEIARRANVNKATVYYHIGNKRTLYEQILKEIFSDLAGLLSRNDDVALPPEVRLRGFIRTLAGLIGQNTDLAAIMLREQASGGRDFPEIVARDFLRIITLISEILDDGFKAGVFKKNTPVIVHVMIIGTLVFMEMSSPIRAKLASRVAAFETIGNGPAAGAAAEIEDLIMDAVKK